jgi:ubiquinone/menaquinone biosynthesis C-methylase UbiE
MSVTDDDIKKFYNEYSDRQKEYSYNERHYYVFNLLKKSGLNKNSTVLDLGCGIGVLDILIAKYCSEGKVTGLDISERSIELANSKIKNLTNIAFKCGNIKDADINEYKDYDFVFLIDALEHIPFAHHENIFQKIALILGNSSRFIINIPYYGATVYAEKYQKDLLQLIDLPVELVHISSLCEKFNLEIKHVLTYDVWQEEEYQYIVVQKKKDYVYKRIKPEYLTFYDRVLLKLKKFR